MSQLELSVAAALREWQRAGRALMQRVEDAVPCESMQRLTAQTLGRIDEITAVVDRVAAVLTFEATEVLLAHVFSFLDVASISRAAQVRRQWRAGADSDAVWSVLCCRKWPSTSFISADCWPGKCGNHRRLFKNRVFSQRKGFSINSNDGASSRRSANLATLNSTVFLTDVYFGSQSIFSAATTADDTLWPVLADGDADTIIDQYSVRLNDSEIIGHDWEDQRWETFRRDFRINVMMFNPDTCACAPLLWCVMRS